MRNLPKALITLYFILFTYITIFSSSTPKAYIIPIKGTIDLGLSSFIKRSIQEAKQKNIQTLIFEIDTFGGRVDAALEISKYILDAKPAKTVAFINKRAWSAGALISLACQEIFMTADSSIGSAQPQSFSLAGEEKITDEKIISALRAEFKSIASVNNHPVNLAIAMVDKDFEIKKIKIKDKTYILTTQEIEDLKSKYKDDEFEIIKTINPKGKLLNLIASEAKEFGLAKDIVKNTEELLNYLSLTIQETTTTQINWSEILARLITHPLVSSLLLTLGILGLLFELQSPGWGVSGTLGIIALLLFFGGHYIAGLANFTEILIFAIGLTLLLCEIFLIPGFGIVGFSGIFLILASIFLSLFKYPLVLPKFQILKALNTLGFTILFLIVGGTFVFKFLSNKKFLSNIILKTEEKKEEGFVCVGNLKSYINKKAKTLTDLRPSGKIEVDGEILDAITEGEFISKNKEVTIIDVKGQNLIVRQDYA